MNKYANNEVLDFASQIGRLLIRYGADTALTCELVQKVATYYGEKSYDISTLGNSFIITEANKAEDVSCHELKMTLIRRKEPNLNIVGKLTELCRRIVQHELSLEDARTQLEEIRQTLPTPLIWRILGAALAGGTICGILGGSWGDLAATMISVIFTFSFKYFLTEKMTPLFGTLLTTFFATLVCMFSFHMGLGNTIASTRIVIACCLTLVPALDLINSLKDIYRGDYVCGLNQLAHFLIVVFVIFGGAVLMVNLLNVLVFDPTFTQPFTTDDSYSFGVMRKLFCAFLAPIGFSVLYSIPSQYLWSIGGIGLFAFLIQNFCGEVVSSLLTEMVNEGETTVLVNDSNMLCVSIFFALCFTYILVAMFSKLHNSPTTTFFVGTVMTVIPDTQLFFAIYNATIQKFELVSSNASEACSILLAIALSLLIGMELHKVMFNRHLHFILR